MNNRELAYELARWAVVIAIIALVFVGALYLLTMGCLL
jgi:hypothetical protein